MDLKKVSRNFGIGMLFCVTLSVGFVTQFVISDKAYSKTENRSLELFPNLEINKLLDKSYQSSIENYSSDQFPNRSSWMKLKTAIDLKLGVRLIQDVYIGENDMLIQKVDFNTNDSNDSDIATIINEFKDRHNSLNFNFILVPNKIELYKELLPENALYTNQQQRYDQFYGSLEESINKIDAMSILKEHKNEYIFYKSDHHWTTLAAKYIADAFLEKDEIAYDVVVSNDQFNGTLSNKIAYYPYADTISLFLPKEEKVQYVVDYVESNKTTTSVYELDKQFDTDAYAIYFGGNHPIIKINTTSTENKRLLIFKDSYANCFIPFLLPYYSEIVVIDPRYYYDDIDKLIEDEEISDVLFLYNMNTFFSDKSLLSLQAEENNQ